MKTHDPACLWAPLRRSPSPPPKVKAMLAAFQGALEMALLGPPSLRTSQLPPSLLSGPAPVNAHTPLGLVAGSSLPVHSSLLK